MVSLYRTPRIHLHTAYDLQLSKRISQKHTAVITQLPSLSILRANVVSGSMNVGACVTSGIHEGMVKALGVTTVQGMILGTSFQARAGTVEGQIPSRNVPTQKTLGSFGIMPP